MKTTLLSMLLLCPLTTVFDWQAIAWSSLWIYVWGAFPLVGLAALVAGKVKRRARMRAIGVGLAVAGIVGAVAARQLNLMQIEANKALGERIAAALDRHWDARGNYPEELGQLVPEFLDEVPAPRICALATRFLYLPSEQRGDFSLVFHVGSSIMLVRVDGEWSPVPMGFSAL